MAGFEEKFLVINYKVLKNIAQTPEGAELLGKFSNYAVDIANLYKDRTGIDISKKKYYVCNSDEPYASEVLEIILKGEGVDEGR